MEITIPGFVVPEAALRQQAAADGITHVSTGIAVIVGGKVLAVRRATDDFLGGNYELPGGGVEAGESFEQAVRRELKEETGLEAAVVLGMFPGFDYHTPQKPSVRQFNLLVCVRDPKVLVLSPEHDAAVWLSSEADIDQLVVTDAMRTCFIDALEVAANF
jgi:8-oxo-dGTP diphosphatase